MAATVSAQLAPKVVMSGLNNPRGLAFGPDGSLYVTEAGSPFTPDASTPFITVRGAQEYFNTSGAISKLSGGVQSTVLTGLPSIFNATSGDVTGAQGIAVNAAGDITFTLGLGADPAVRTGAFSPFGTLNRLSSGASSPTIVADISAYEGTFNPAGGFVDSNPYNIVQSGGQTWVADAGGNSVLNVDAAGNVSLVGTLAPLLGGIDAVPTSLALAPDGTLYGRQLTGAPFPVGGAGVYAFGPSGPTLISDGFTNVIDIAYGQNGLLYVLELAHNGLISGDPTGGLWQLNPLTGEKKLLLTDGLFLPTALSLDDDGHVFVANFGVIPGQGQVLELVPVPEPATTGMAAVGVLAAVIMLRRRKKSKNVSAALEVRQMEESPQAN